MIFIPDRENCSIWNETEDYIVIVYNYNENVKINFEWKKYKDQFDPFYISIKEIIIINNNGDILNLDVMPCNEYYCKELPQLRYNDIMKKWYACCPSSMLCTENDDEDEIELFKCVDLIEKNGFYNDPINAILHWQK